MGSKMVLPLSLGFVGLSGCGVHVNPEKTDLLQDLEII